MMNEDLGFMSVALAQAKKSLKEGGIPIGACLVVDGKVIACGHNKRVQKGSAILHGEMDCLENAGRLKASDYEKATIYTTLSPCIMCSGAILLYKIPRVVMAENKNFIGAESLLKSRGVELINLNMPEAIALMSKFIRENPCVWQEDIGSVEI